MALLDLHNAVRAGIYAVDWMGSDGKDGEFGEWAEKG